jgi:pilus assembly protein CpaC
LVRPVNASQIALPTDGFRNATGLERVLLDSRDNSRDGAVRPGPTMAEPQSRGPAIGAATPLPAPAAPPQRQARQEKQQAIRPQQPSAAPGFSF